MPDEGLVRACGNFVELCGDSEVHHSAAFTHRPQSMLSARTPLRGRAALRSRVQRRALQVCSMNFLGLGQNKDVKTTASNFHQLSATDIVSRQGSRLDSWGSGGTSGSLTAGPKHGEPQVQRRMPGAAIPAAAYRA
jgi:hypothetical protein